ncbi:hypothetical protein WDJ51_09905 [Rathayibacter sp. YIM 133350]|uniref:hypothetical protein n=1 Tax=Rathayibacter sp. YIM 133350 TaxID=3131992 RepID=UPI00307E6BF2
MTDTTNSGQNNDPIETSDDLLVDVEAPDTAGQDPTPVDDATAHLGEAAQDGAEAVGTFAQGVAEKATSAGEHLQDAAASLTDDTGADAKTTANEVIDTLKQGSADLADAVTKTASQLSAKAEAEYRRNPGKVIAVAVAAVGGLVFIARAIAKRS